VGATGDVRKRRGNQVRVLVGAAKQDSHQTETKTKWSGKEEGGDAKNVKLALVTTEGVKDPC